MQNNVDKLVIFKKFVQYLVYMYLNISIETNDVIKVFYLKFKKYQISMSRCGCYRFGKGFFYVEARRQESRKKKMNL